MTNKKIIIFLSILFVVGFILRILSYINYSGCVASDAPAYLEMADSISNGKGYTKPDTGTPTAYRPPGYPFFIAAVYYVFPNAGLGTLRFLNTIFSCLTIIFVYLILIKIADKKSAILASVITTLYPAFIYFSGLIITETIFTFLFTLSVYLLLRSNLKASNFIAVGLIWGISILLRPTILFLPLYIFFLTVIFSKKSPVKWKSALIILVVTYLVVFPWTFRNYLRFHKFIPVSTNGGGILFQGFFPHPKGFGFTPFDKMNEVRPEGLNEAETSSFYTNYTLKYAITHPLNSVKLAILKEISFFSPLDGKRNRLGSNYNFVYGIVMMAALWALWNNRKPTAGWIIIYALIMYFILLTLIVPGTPRYRLPVDVFFIMMASYGMMDMCSKGKKGIYILSSIVFINLLVYALANPVIKIVKPYLMNMFN